MNGTGMLTLAMAALVLAGCERTPTANAPAQADGEAGRPSGTGTVAAAPASPAAAPSAKASESQAATSPCLTQDGQQLSVAPLRAVGTEPFWGAKIEGRCVTYSHPEDQQGTRVWTRYTPGRGGGGTWTGTLGGRPFVLRARPQAGCSDGMSDRRYPFAVELTVGGEERQGCAEPG